VFCQHRRDFEVVIILLLACVQVTVIDGCECEGHLMNPYWAEFKQVGEHLFRYDTRVYLAGVDHCKPSDPRIGAIVAKNPGSANPSDITASGIQPINIGKDKLIPVVSSFLRQAYATANKQPPARGYVQVFNLFHLCNK